MMRGFLCVFLIAAALASASSALAYKGIEMGEVDRCIRCHSLEFDEATDLVKSVNPEVEVIEIKQGPLAGLWEIIVMARGKRGIAYIDFSKSHIITGSIIDVDTRQNLTNLRLYEISKVDVSEIPIEDALLLGNPEARFKAIVFDDPDCPYCKNLHREMRSIVEENGDIAFYIKLFPLKIHPAAYKKAKSILCRRSIALLERSFDGRSVPEPNCETSAVDETIELAERLGITTTPTVILPDGGVIVGFKDREILTDLVETAGRAVEEMVAAHQAELETERLRKLREMEDKDFKEAKKKDSIESYRDFLGKYPEGERRKGALFRMATLIDREPDSLVRFRDFIATYPDGLVTIPEEHRLLYVGPDELPVFAILELLREGETERSVVRRISSTEGAYKEFSVEEVRQLGELGLSDSMVEAMLETTFMAKKREAEARREDERNRLTEAMDRLQAAIYDMEASFESKRSLEPDLPLEAITDEVGTPLSEKIDRCKVMIEDLAECRKASDVGECRLAAESRFPCQ
jgi:thiol:disulfide interchange protein DsbC